MAALAATPSPSVALVVARSATSGFANGAAVASGIVLGDLLFATLALLGMSALAETVGSVFIVFRFLGGGYLVWLGVDLLRSSRESSAAFDDSRPSRMAASFAGGLLITLGDVKAVLFYASIFPAFADMAALQASDILAIICITAITVGGVKLIYALLAKRLTNRFRNLASRRRSKLAAGSVLMGAGAYVITKA